MRDAMSECQGVFHLAAYTRINAKSRSKTERLNVEIKRNVGAMVKELRENQQQAKTKGTTVSSRDSVLLEIPVDFATPVRVIRRCVRSRLSRAPTWSSAAAMSAAEVSCTRLI